MEAQATSWMKLDNAALIYPATMNRNWTALFRLSATLKEPVDAGVLERAARRAIARFPSLAVRLRRGMFWFYFEHCDSPPIIEQDAANPCVRMRLKDNGGQGLRIRYYRNRIAVEFFHVLTDGTGGFVFLRTLVAEYLRLKYGAEIPFSEEILDCDAPPDEAELEDSFARFSGGETQSRREQKAYYIKGTDEAGGFIHITTGEMDAAQMLKLAHEKGVSLTEYLTAVLLLSVDAIQRRREPNRRRYKPVKVSVPINLRRFFPSRTVRNFSSYVNVGIDPLLGDYDFDEVLKIVHHFMAIEVTQKRLLARFTTNVQTQKSFILRIMPLFIKNTAMKIAYKQVGDVLYSTSFSNLGAAKLPEEMAPYVQHMDFILGPLARNRVCAAMISYEGRLRMNFTRTIEEPLLEKEFFTRLVRLGAHVLVESNQRE